MWLLSRTYFISQFSPKSMTPATGIDSETHTTWAEPMGFSLSGDSSSYQESDIILWDLKIAKVL